MKIEIWSDVMCPFCYIGKRNFESAINQFSDKEHIEVIWRSFQLDPSMPEVAEASYLDYLVKRKGLGASQVQQMLDNVTQSAKQVGLDYYLEKSQIVNSHKAHQLIQFAQTKGKGDQAEEVLFKAFFTEGKSIADLNVLLQLGKQLDLNHNELETALSENKYSVHVDNDIQEAKKIGVNSVPFFVFDRKVAISGAQSPQIFLETLTKSFSQWRKLNPETNLNIIEGQSCDVNGVCG